MPKSISFLADGRLLDGRGHLLFAGQPRCRLACWQGQQMPTWAEASTPLMPSSAKVGTSGSWGRRVGLATASGRTLPPALDEACASSQVHHHGGYTARRPGR